MSDYKSFAKDIVQNWKEENESSFSFNRSSLAKLSSDLLIYLDNSIHYAEDNGVDSTGQGKKTIVLAVMQIIFIGIVSNNLPIYLKPFDRLIKFLVIHVFLSVMIDFIVKKYKNGMWKKEAQNEV